MDKITIEICAFSIETAIKAERGGADRIELCSNPLEGGTTPNYGLIKVVCEKTSIPVYPLIRPRGGDFCYSANEIVSLAQPMGVTFSRAFDLTPLPHEALELILKAGCERILTSGQAKNVIEATGV